MSNEEKITAEEFVQDLDRARSEVERLQQSNISKVQALAQMGKGIDAAMLANIKIEILLETIFDEGAQLVYVRNLETRLKGLLDEALKAARQEQITQKSTGSHPGLYIPR